jgi:hypothetical protein
MLTYDSQALTMDAAGNMRGKTLYTPDGRPFTVRQATYDKATGKQKGWRTADSTGAFLVGELERLDLRLHEPLAAVTWGRDIDLREDVTIANEVSSFTLSTYAQAGGTGQSAPTFAGGKAWVGKDTTQITGMAVDLAKIAHPLRPWATEVKYTILELESAALVGRPIDQQKFFGMQLKHQMDIDAQVYVGDPEFGDKGLATADTAPANSGQVLNVSTAANGASGSPLWTQKSPDEILADVNTLLNSTWANSGYSFPPDRLLLPPENYSYISTIRIGEAGQFSILKYLLENNLLTSSGTAQIKIFPLKWLPGLGVGGTPGNPATPSRMVAYTKDPERVRYPMTLMQRTPIQYDGIYHKATYFCRLGVTEIVYPETVGYLDGT